MFFYKDSNLVFKQGKSIITIKDIAKNRSESFYLYDIDGLKKWYRYFVKATQTRLKIFFAMKANFNKHILKAFLEEGSGVDVVSIGEARLARAIGFNPQQIVFSGVGKSVLELTEAVKDDFFQINIESLEELKKLAKICREQNKSCKIGLRINPNVNFESHPYIKTGLSGHKFGFEEEELPVLLKFIRSQKPLQLQGLSMHLGSQIFDLEPLSKAISRVMELYKKLKSEQYPLSVMDIGGGLGVNYQNCDFEEERERLDSFGKRLNKLLKGFEGTVIAEPGRFLVARFGLLCAKVEYIKKSPKKQFIILNSGMNHFLRPALYGAKHRLLPLENSESDKQSYDVVGPICETGDTVAKDYLLPKIKSGDWLAIADTGAYGFVLANHYNLREPATEICFSKGKRLLSHKS